ncbi:sulfurtransferase [soil metagenome]
MIKRFAIASLALMALAAPAMAASPRDQLVVSTAWLAGHLTDPDLIILQVGDKPGYDAGHIPGAQLITIAEFSAPPVPDGLTLEMPDPTALHDRLAAHGVSDRSRIIVVYGSDGIQSATRLAFTLDAAGLGARTSLLDGGLGAWKRESRAVSTDVPAVKTAMLSPLKMKAEVVDAAFVKAHLNSPGFSIVDGRAPGFYSGAQTGGSPAKPQKSGHIAGAKSMPFSAVTAPGLTLLSSDELTAKFAAAGIKPGDTVVAYCHVGQQATAALFAARTLGYNVLLYDGSYEDWARQDGPVDNPSAKPAP